MDSYLTLWSLQSLSVVVGCSLIIGTETKPILVPRLISRRNNDKIAEWRKFSNLEKDSGD